MVSTKAWLDTHSTIGPTRTRRCSAQSGLQTVHTVATPGRLFRTHPMQVPPELTMSDEALRHAESENAVRSFQAHLKEVTYRHNCGVPNLITLFAFIFFLNIIRVG